MGKLPDAVESKEVCIEIQYCSEDGEHYKSAVKLIQNMFPASQFPECNMVFKESKDEDVTGNFEIKVNGQLVHSKKTKEHGFLHENKKQQMVVSDAIENAIDD